MELAGAGMRDREPDINGAAAVSYPARRTGLELLGREQVARGAQIVANYFYLS